MKYRPNRLTIEIVKERYKDSKLELVSDVYKNNHEHLYWECKMCGYVFPRSLGKIQASESCDCCEGRLPISIYSIQYYLRDKPLKLLSKEYIDNSTYLDFACTVPGCNKIFPRTWAKLRESHSCPRCNGYEDITVEDVKALVKDKPLELLSTVYVNQDTDLMWRCLVDGCDHIFPRTYANIQRTTKCPKCEDRWDLTLAVAKERLGLVNINVLSDYYEHKDTILEVRCAVKGCTNTWKASYRQIMYDKVRCKDHYGIKKYTIESIKQKLIDDKRNIKLLSNEYVNAQEDIDWECLVCGHKWPATAGSVLSANSGCGPCSNNVTYTIDILKEKLIESNIPLQYVSGEYKNSRSVLNWKCLNPTCGIIFPKSWDKIYHRDKMCLTCKPKGRSTANKTIVERDPNYYLKQKCYVYIIKCYDEHESFYKIGYAKNSVQERMWTYPYTCEVLKIIETNRYDAVYIESDLHVFHREHTYNPLKVFGGYRECFSKVHIKV